MDLLRKKIIEAGAPKSPVENYDVISRLLYKVDKHTASMLLHNIQQEYPAWKIYELYKINEMRHILLDYYGGRL